MSDAVNVQFVITDSSGNYYKSDEISLEELDQEVRDQGGIDMPDGKIYTGSEFIKAFVKMAVDGKGAANVSILIDGTTRYFNPSLIFSAAAIHTDANGEIVPVAL